MGLERDIQIGEIYDIKHRFDSKNNRHYDYENTLLKKTTPSYLWKNDNNNMFLSKIQKITVLMVEQVNLARNYFNPTVHKYYDDYWG